MILSREPLSMHALMPRKQCVVTVCVYVFSYSTPVQKIRRDMFSMEINMVMIIKQPSAGMVCPHTLTPCNFHIRSVACAHVCVRCSVRQRERESWCECERECVKERESERDTLAQLHI